MHKELAPYWKVKEIYHYDDVFDAVLFENESQYPYKKNDWTQILAIRGTTALPDYKADISITLGSNPR